MRPSSPSSGTPSLLRRALFVAALALPVAMTGCAAPTDDDDDGASADESALTGSVYDAGVTLRVTANRLNVRTGGGMSYRVITQVSRDVRVTVVQRSGGDGWVNIRTPNGTVGWASGTYLTPAGGWADDADTDDGDDVPDTTTAAGGTCAPGRAAGIVNRYQKALHDTLAFAEGTRARSNDGYDILFGGTNISSCARHPNQCIKYGKSCSTAAGRYQFLYRTWDSIANARGYATFEPENQERGAAYLISSVRKANVPADRALSSAEFTNVITKLSYEWASLPPGQYGQPNKSMAELRRVYCSVAGC